MPIKQTLFSCLQYMKSKLYLLITSTLMLITFSLMSATVSHASETQVSISNWGFSGFVEQTNFNDPGNNYRISIRNESRGLTETLYFSNSPEAHVAGTGNTTDGNFTPNMYYITIEFLSGPVLFKSLQYMNGAYGPSVGLTNIAFFGYLDGVDVYGGAKSTIPNSFPFSFPPGNMTAADTSVQSIAVDRIVIRVEELDGMDIAGFGIRGFTIAEAVSTPTYTVTFNLNGGTRTGGGALTQTVNQGEDATAPTLTPPTGKVFDSWSTSFTNVQNDLTVTANYVDATYTVTFDPNGGTRTGGGELIQTVTHGQDAIAPTLTRTGYTQAGWDASLTNIVATQTIEAFWNINSYTLTYNFNYSGSPSAEQLVVDFNSTQNLPVEPTRQYYDFVKWNSEPDGSGTDYTGSFNMPASALTLYAQWELESYTVTFRDYDNSILSSQQVQRGSAATAPAAPSRTGYTFREWDSSFSEITEDTTINAVYDINEYTISVTTNQYLERGTITASATTVEHGDSVEFTGESGPYLSLSQSVGGTCPAGSWSGLTYSIDSVTADCSVSFSYQVNVYRQQTLFPFNQGSYRTVVAPDGNNVYVLAYTNNIIYNYTRNDGTGLLTSNPNFSDVNVAAPSDIQFLNDGLGAYIASHGSDRITYVDRLIGDSGRLQRAGSFDLTAVGSTSSYPSALLLSPDERFMYVHSGPTESIYVLERDPTDNSLSHVATTQTAGYLWAPQDMAVSPKQHLHITADGRYLIVVSSTTSAVLVYHRDATTGELSLVQIEDAPSSINFFSLAVSSDDRHIYVGSDDINGQLKAYDFNAITGTLSNFRTIAVDTAGDSAVTTLLLMSNSQYLVVGKSGVTGSFAVLRRDANSGDLELLADVREGVSSIGNNMSAPESWAEDPNSRHLYVAASYVGGGSDGNRVFAFDIPAIGIRDVETQRRFIPNVSMELFDQLQLSSPDDVLISSATVEFISGQDSGDVLAATASGNIDVNDTSSGLVLDNTDTLAHYQQVLRTVTFSTSAIGNGPRVVRLHLVADDGRTGTVLVNLDVQMYTVTFDLGDGTRIGGGELVQNVPHGAAAVAPDVSAPLGQDFDSWSASFDEITADLTVTASYEWQFFTVTFDLAGGSNISGTPLTQTVRYGLSADEPNVLRSGYTFLGWSEPVDEVTRDLDVEALYSVNEYTITWHYNYPGSAPPLQKTYEFNSIVTREVPPVRDSHSFVAWTTDEAGTGGPFPENFQYIIAVDISLYAQWEINEYTVSFQDWDETPLTQEFVEHGSAATGPTPTRTGYTFTGWSAAIDNITSDLTVTAEYDINIYDVTFLGVDDVVLEVQPVEFGSAAVAPDVPFTAGYVFQNWDVDFSEITDHLTVRAEFKRAFMVLNYSFRDAVGVYIESDTLTSSGSPVYVHTDGEFRLQRTSSSRWELRDNESPSTHYAYVIGTNDLPSSGLWFSHRNRESQVLVQPYQPAVSFQHSAISTNNFEDEGDARGLLIDLITLGSQSFVGAAGDDLIASGAVQFNNMPTGYRGELTFIDRTTLKLRALGTNSSIDINTLYEEVEIEFFNAAFEDIFANEVYQSVHMIDMGVLGYFNEFELTEVVSEVKTLSLNIDRLLLGYLEDAYAGLPSLDSGPYNYAYVEQSFQVNTPGVYLLGQTGAPLDTVMLLYRGEFDPLNPGTNLIGFNAGMTSRTISDTTWDGTWLVGIERAGCLYVGNTCPAMESTLDVDETYVMVFSHYDSAAINTMALPQTLFIHGESESWFTRTVSLSTGDNGSVPAATISARTDLPFSVTVIPDTGYQPASAVTGSCPAGTWAGNTYTINEVTADCSLGFSFEPASFTLTVDAQNGDAPVVSTVAFDSLVHLPTEPTRDWYNFVGWNSAADGAGSSYDADFTMPATDLTLYAQWQIQTFSVRFLDWDGSVLSSQTVDWNTAATAPADPERDGYTFTGWSVAFDVITANLDVTAQYNINTFTVRFLDWDDSVIATETVNWNEGATAPADPERDGHTFVGWDVGFTTITSDLDVTAQYDINTFTVRFLDWDDSVIATETVNWNEAAIAPANPTRELYEFIGWDRAFDAVTSDMDITAQYERNAFVVTATVITVDGFGVVTPMVQQVPRGGTATFEAWTSMRYRIRSVQSDCGVTFERSGRTYLFDDIRQDCEVVFEYRKVRSSIVTLLKMHGAVIQTQDDEMPENF